MFKLQIMVGALWCVGAYAQALTFPTQPNMLPGGSPLGQVNQGLVGVDDNGNPQGWDTNTSEISTISQADYATLFGATLAFPSSAYALINARYFDSTFMLQGLPPAMFAPLPAFYFGGAEAAAFTPAYGGPEFVSSTITFNGYNGDTLVASDTFDLSSTSFSWLASSFASTPITQLDIVSAGLGQRWLIDKLALTPIVPLTEVAAVPEPETWALLLLGLGASCARWRQQRRPARPLTGRDLKGAQPCNV
ncbi:PEP-CTERM sorting domain-containing protein [Amantichitinum ursilacus]|uniref:PEP-CTERM motif protein n=1 Tax=Amantichitinum ursilacus TaxID=857265 RepID=A0A0N0XKI2_9NEIS|nr:PEP-CTERM sorting domain-containing protein [Amantichitinum ursilacus]KPC54636.1 PEP-CTERM motif protein [Amantichitinum ursilacus]